MALQMALRFHQRVPRVWKVLDRRPRPQSPVGAYINNMFGSEPQPLQQREKRVEPFAGSGPVVDAHEAVTEFRQD